MQKKEAGFQIKFKHWLQENPPKKSTAYELKYERTDRFNFKQWVEKYGHQLRSLLQSEEGNLYHKISDSGIGFKPFDCFVLSRADSWLVIYFEKKQKAIAVKPKLTLKLLQSGKKSASFDELAENKSNKILKI